MKKIIIFLAALLGFSVVADAQLLKSAYFMDGSVVRSNLNPAFRPKRGYISIPVAGALNIDINSPLAADDLLFRTKDGDIVTFLDKSITTDQFDKKIGFSDRTEPYNFDIGISTGIIGAGFYVGRSFFSLGVDADFAIGAAIPGDMFRLIKSGTGYGSTFDFSSLGMSFESTAKLSAGYSLRLPGFLSGLTIGARANLKLGFLRANISYDRFALYAQKGFWEVDALGTMDIISPVGDRPDFINADGSFNFENFPAFLEKVWNNFQPIGMGMGIDLGAEYDLGFLKASVSVLDLGKMTWNKSHTWRGQAQSQFLIEGFVVEDGEFKAMDTPALGDIIKFKGDETTTINESVTTPMQATIAMGVEFDLLRDIIGLGLVYMYKNREYTKSAQLSANITLRPLSWLSGSLSYTFENYRNIGANSFNTFGAAVNLHTSWINFFVGTDYIMNKFGSYSGIPIPISQKYFNVYVGLAIPLGKGKYE